MSRASSSRTGPSRSRPICAHSGFQAWLVGGCVRDLVLGREPKDYDISTDATPGGTAGAVSQGPTGGRAIRRRAGGWRGSRDVPQRSCLRRWPPSRSVSRLKPIREQDVLRRDFTINALLLDPAILDPRIPRLPCLPMLSTTSAASTICARRSSGPSAIPRQRFEEDHLRMLRAIRFAARFGFEIEPATMAAIQELHSQIQRVSPERIRDELVRILTEGGARRGLRIAGRLRPARRHSARSCRDEGRGCSRPSFIPRATSGRIR